MAPDVVALHATSMRSIAASAWPRIHLHLNIVILTEEAVGCRVGGQAIAVGEPARRKNQSHGPKRARMKPASRGSTRPSAFASAASQSGSPVSTSQPETAHYEAGYGRSLTCLHYSTSTAPHLPSGEMVTAGESPALLSRWFPEGRISIAGRRWGGGGRSRRRGW